MRQQQRPVPQGIGRFVVFHDERHERRPSPPRFAQAPLALEPASVVPAAASSLLHPSRCCAPSTDARLAAADATAVPSAKPHLRPSRTPPPSAASASASTARAPACAGDDVHGDGASTSATAAACGTSPGWSGCPMRALGLRAVADGDERHDASPDIGAAAPERPGVTKPDTSDDHGDRHAAPIMIASLYTSSRLPSNRPSPNRRARTTVCPRAPTRDRAARRPRRALHLRAHRPIPLPKTIMTMMMATAHRRLRPLPPCSNSPARDELHASCARSASAPSPMATSATTPCRSSVQPCLHDPASPRPTGTTIACCTAAARMKLPVPDPVAPATAACPEQRAASLFSCALFPSQFNRAGPDLFYIELVSRSTLARFGSHTRLTDGAGLQPVVRLRSPA